MPTTPTTPSEADSLAQLRSALVGFVARRVESRELAEDIVQDVLERAHRADRSAVNDPKAWLYRAARNAVIDHYRGRVRHEELPPEIASWEEPEAPIDSAGPNAATQELARCMRPFVERLEEPYRRAVTLVDLDGKTHAEAARAEHVSVSGMKSRVQRGRSALAADLQACCAVAVDGGGRVSGYEPRERECC